MNLNSTEDLVFDLYANDLHLIAKNFCESAKNSSEILLKNKEIKEASTPLLKEFRNSLNDFLRDYPAIKRYEIYELILATFIKMAGDHDELDIVKPHDRDMEISEIEVELQREKEQEFRKIFQKYFTETFREYENNYQKLIKKVLPKLQVFKENLQEENIFKYYKLTEILNNLEKCQNYACFPINHYDFLKILTKNSNSYVKYKKSNIENLLTLILIAIDNVSKDILRQEEKIAQLSFDCKDKFTNDIKNFVTNFENNNKIKIFLQTFDLIDIYFLKKYYNTLECSENDRNILNDILEKYLNDDSKFDSEYELAKSTVIFKMTFK